MGFQTTVNVLLNVGVIGDIILDEPHRIQPVTLDSVGGTIGNAFTKSNTTGIATQGGAITNGSTVFAGIAVLPKIEPLFGAGATDPLSASLVLQPNAQVAMLTMGSCLVNITTTYNVGDLVQYNLTTGVIGAYAPGGSVTSGFATVPNAVVYGSPSQGGVVGSGAANSVAIIRLTN